MSEFKLPKGAIERERVEAILSRLSALESRASALESKVAKFEAAIAARKGKTETEAKG